MWQALLILALILLVLGYAIRVNKQLQLIAGYDPDKVQDKGGLARWVGGNLLLLGLLALVDGVVGYLQPEWLGAIFIAYLVIFLFGIFFTAYRGRKF